ncbi:solute carrier family 15 member 1-like isoform X3 [Varroa destructor]|uniref:Oligopeptide transporter 1 n=1 Tax=Varroa destructor TaxID=109461 RepID=A0A7M7KES4_VARDE|nr:solute carrier family 15 member 1-like isoform X3 [Varroa destructor]
MKMNQKENDTTSVTDEGGLNSPAKEIPYPKSVFFIISNEFCERFSYYGMRTVLVIYLSSILLYSEEDTKSIYHAFTMACYFTPLLGAIIADSWLGKFKTIFYISIIYAIGNAVLSIGSFNLGLETQIIFSLLGLGLIAIGTGGIKPCVAAFGGDQFVRGQELYLEQFFSIFYMCINAGSVLSTAITPYLRAIPCNGRDSCFPLAFGVPAILMVISLVLFMLGSPFYRKTPPGDNVIVKLGGCISHAIANKFFRATDTREHWLDYADDIYDQKFIEEVKSVCRVMVIYIPVPIFWALFDQQGSSWTLQATRMRWQVFGFRLLPDQIQLLNPLLILILAPLFGYVLYPMCKNCGLLTKPLQKMIVGGVLAAASFIVCMFLQFAVEAQDSNAMTLINTTPCQLKVTYDLGDKHNVFAPKANGDFLKINRPYPYVVNITATCGNETQGPLNYKPDFSHRASREKLIMLRGDNKDIQVIDIPELGKGDAIDVKVFADRELDLELISSNDERFNLTRQEEPDLGDLRFYRAELQSDETYTLRYSDMTCMPGRLQTGEAYTFVVTNKTCTMNLTQAAPAMSLMWQAPQYILITTGEVLFSVTGLEFSYSEAPKSMKSVLQAGWLMTVAIGNLLVVIVAKIGLEKQSTEFLVFGLAMFADMIFFAVLAYFYTPSSALSEMASQEGEMYEVSKEELSA